MLTILGDVGYGLRILRRSPGFTVTAILTLGLGIAVNTTVFSWINSVLLHPYPGVADTRDLALLETVNPPASIWRPPPGWTTAITATI